MKINYKILSERDLRAARPTTTRTTKLTKSGSLSFDFRSRFSTLEDFRQLSSNVFVLWSLNFLYTKIVHSCENCEKKPQTRRTTGPKLALVSPSVKFITFELNYNHIAYRRSRIWFIYDICELWFVKNRIPQLKKGEGGSKAREEFGFCVSWDTVYEILK